MSVVGGQGNNFLRTLSFLAALGSLAWLVLVLQWLRGIRNVPVLQDFRKPGRMNRNPALSVVLAARNEDRSVNESVVSMLAQDYAGILEVIAVNDRSTDRTGEILDALVTKHPGNHQVLHVELLPMGCWGKPTPCTSVQRRQQENGSCSPTPM
jgi:cellulose synthase/poly-beta-1,6-N-acetylglucosamine synthase-like glycosyltransferase